MAAVGDAEHSGGVSLNRWEREGLRPLLEVLHVICFFVLIFCLDLFLCCFCVVFAVFVFVLRLFCFVLCVVFL